MRTSRKRFRLELSAVFAAVVATGWLTLTGIAKAQDDPPPPPVTIGATGNFAILSDAGPLSLGNHTIVSGVGASVASTYANLVIGDAQTKIQGNAIATQFDQNPPPANTTELNYGHVAGACVTDGGPITLHTGATCGSKVMDPDSPYIVTLGDAVDNEEVVDAAILCQTPTQTLGPIVLGAGKKETITDTLPGELNVISTPSITLGNSSTLTLSGGPTDTLVLETTGTPGEGKITVGFSAKIVLAGGLVPSNVWISSTPEPAGFNPPAANPSLTLKNSSVIYGTLHGGYTCLLGSSVTINGAIICDYGFTSGHNLTVNFEPATGLSLPNCITDDPIDLDD